MNKFVYPLFKKVAFSLDAELAHELTIKSMKLFGKAMSDHQHPHELSLNVLGMDFKNPFGLAAGLDKNAEAIDFLTHLPFGFIEVGTVTPLAQAGNDRPRLFRYPEEESLRNRMGFNNHGAKIVLANLLNADKRNKIVGVNLGKNKSTPNDEAASDYIKLYQTFSEHADYLVVNVSSPNTPGLRDLLNDRGLRDIFEGLDKQRKLNSKNLFVKISPDMSEDQLNSVVGLVNEYGLSGIIATNTTIMPERGEGGISGKLLKVKATKTRNLILDEIKKTNSKAELIGVGGIDSFEEVQDFWKRGGKLIQVYSGFIFHGPNLLSNFEERLLKDMHKKGAKTLNEYFSSLQK